MPRLRRLGGVSGEGVLPIPDRTPQSRPCPVCPAGPWASCARWSGERTREAGVSFSGGGRWIRLKSGHRARVQPGSQDAVVLNVTSRPSTPCGAGVEHGYHEHGDGWCRGEFKR